MIHTSIPKSVYLAVVEYPGGEIIAHNIDAAEYDIALIYKKNLELDFANCEIKLVEYRIVEG